MGGRFHKALNAIRVALNTDSKFAEAYNEKGLVHRKLGESGAAIKAYQKAFRLKPKSAPIALNLGICYLYEENEKQAEIYFKKAVQLGPRYGYAQEDELQVEEKLVFIRLLRQFQGIDCRVYLPLHIQFRSPSSLRTTARQPPYKSHPFYPAGHRLPSPDDPSPA